MAVPILAVLLVASGAAAGGEDFFGRRGDVLPFGSVSFRHTSLNNTDTNSVSVAPGVLVFPADGFAVGLSVLYAYTTGVPVAGQTAPLRQGIHSAGFEPIVGGTIPIGDRAALFPRLSMRFLWTIPSAPGPRVNLITIRGFVPVVFAPIRHFYLGFGPEFSADVSASVGGKETGIGLASEIGGWF